MRLVPVVEVNSQCFQNRKHDRPNHDDEHLQERNVYWRNSLEDAGILEIPPYLDLDSCWLVEISKLNSEIVRILLDRESEMDYGTMTEYHRMMELEGGYILEVFNSVEVLPRCCSDLGTIGGWEEASNWTSSEDMLLWIGHPSLLVSAVDSQYLLIKEEDVYLAVEPVKLIIDRNELKSAIIDTRKQLDDFSKMVITSMQSGKK
jgi:hypothetical protein